MKNYIKPEVKVYEVRIESLLTGNVTILSLMRKMMTDILVAAIFGTTKTLKIE